LSRFGRSVVGLGVVTTTGGDVLAEYGADVDAPIKHMDSN